MVVLRAIAVLGPRPCRNTPPQAAEDQHRGAVQYPWRSVVAGQLPSASGTVLLSRRGGYMRRWRV